MICKAGCQQPGGSMYDEKVVLTEQEKKLLKTAQRALVIARESVWEMVNQKSDISSTAFNAMVGPLAAAIYADLRKSGE